MPSAVAVKLGQGLNYAEKNDFYVFEVWTNLKNPNFFLKSNSAISDFFLKNQKFI